MEEKKSEESTFELTKEDLNRLKQILFKGLEGFFGIRDITSKYKFLTDPNNLKTMSRLTNNQVEGVYLSYGLETIYGIESQRALSEEMMASNVSTEKGKGRSELVDFEKASKEIPFGILSPGTSITQAKQEQEGKKGLFGRFRRKQVEAE